jgi:hypothetical protein
MRKSQTIVPLTEVKTHHSVDSDGRVEMSFEGFGAVFGNVDSHGDVIQHGAFKSFLSKATPNQPGWPAMLVQHGGQGLTAQDLMPVGKWTSLSESDDGLVAEGKLAHTPRGQEAYELMKMGALDGLSIGYVARDWEMKNGPNGERRILKGIDLSEISLVTWPSNPNSRITAVKSIQQLTSVREIEDYLREFFGMTKAESVMLISRIKAADRGDPAGGSRDAGDLSVAQLAALLKRNSAILR